MGDMNAKVGDESVDEVVGKWEYPDEMKTVSGWRMSVLREGCFWLISSFGTR